MECPKCGQTVRDVATFCTRCHNTLRFKCPACSNEQTHGGKCDKCGVDFLKYISAVVSSKAAEADAIHDRLEQRSVFIKNLMWLPFTLGIPIIRDYFVKRDRRK